MGLKNFDAAAAVPMMSAASPNFMTTSLDFLANWARTGSLWPMPFGTACCAIEFMATAASRYDISRFGMERMSFSPRQADVLICAGRLPFKLAPVIRRVWDQMPQPKWSISMGACASSGGIFDNYAMVQGIDTIIPVDVYVPGCPAPRGAALRDHAPDEEDPGRDVHRRVPPPRADGRPQRALPPGRSHRRALRAVRQLRLPDALHVTAPSPSVPALRGRFGEAIERHLVSCGDTIAYVHVERVHDVLAWLKDTPGQDYAYLVDITAVDYRDPERPLEVAWQLRSFKGGDLRIKTTLPSGGPLEVRAAGTSGAAPTGWSARSSTCSASSSWGTPTSAAS